MGQKVNPISLRLGIIKDWSSNWYAKKKDFAANLLEDYKIRIFIKKNFASANISLIEIARASNKIKVAIHTARPGVIIGRRGADVDRLRDELQGLTNKDVLIDIKEIKNPSAQAQLIAENVAFQLTKRIGHRRALKKAVQLALDAGAGGIKIRVAGRLGGAEMSRTEVIMRGKVPLHTLRADIDYGFAEAITTYGKIGVKVWVYKGEIIREKKHGIDAQKG